MNQSFFFFFFFVFFFFFFFWGGGGEGRGLLLLDGNFKSFNELQLCSIKHLQSFSYLHYVLSFCQVSFCRQTCSF